MVKVLKSSPLKFQVHFFLQCCVPQYCHVPVVDAGSVEEPATGGSQLPQSFGAEQGGV